MMKTKGQNLVLPLLVVILLLECVIGQGTKRKEFKIAVIAPQTGTSAYFGKVVANGIVLSLKSDGGIDYRVLDDKSDPATAVALVRDVNKWGAASIIGPLDSDVTAAAANEAQHLKIPIISPCATASYLTDSDNQWFFRANTSDRQRAEEIASWATELIGHQGLLVVNEARSVEDQNKGRAPLYGEALASDLLHALTSRQVPASAVSFERGAFNDTTKQAVTERISAGVVGAVAILSRDIDEVPIAEFVRKRFSDLPVFLVASGRDLFDKSAVKDGVYAVTPTVIEATKSNVLEDFRRRYTLEFPGEPTPTQQCAAYGYDTAEIVLAAIKRAVKKRRTASIGELRSEVRDQLLATPNDRQGLMSVGGFTQQRELNFRPHRLLLVDGTWVENGTVPKGGLPPWMVAMYLAVLLLFLGCLIAVLVWQLPKLHRFGDRTVVFVISAFVGLVSALITFGALRSYGHVSGQTLGVAFEFGGPAALFILVLLLGTRTKSDNKPFTVTAIVREGAHGGNVVAVDGSISLLLAKGARETKIKNGQAVFESLESEYKNQSVDYVVFIPGYLRIRDAPQLRLTVDAVLDVRVRKISQDPAPPEREAVDSLRGGNHR